MRISVNAVRRIPLGLSYILDPVPIATEGKACLPSIASCEGWTPPAIGIRK